MTTLPEIDNVRDILENYQYIKGENNRLNSKEISKLISLELKNKTRILNIDNRSDIYNILNIVSIMGYENAMLYLKKSSSYNSTTDIIKLSPLFEKERRRYFLDITKDLRNKTVIKGIYPCKKCGSWEVTTQLKQTRGLDEPATEINKCQVCGHGWRN